MPPADGQRYHVSDPGQTQHQEQLLEGVDVEKGLKKLFSHQHNPEHLGIALSGPLFLGGCPDAEKEVVGGGEEEAEVEGEEGSNETVEVKELGGFIKRGFILMVCFT